MHIHVCYNCVIAELIFCEVKSAMLYESLISVVKFKGILVNTIFTNIKQF